MSAGAVDRIVDVLSRFGTVYFYAVDPGADAAMEPVVDARRSRGAASVWVLDGWSRERHGADASPCLSPGELLRSSHDDLVGSAVVVGSQTDFAITRRMVRACSQAGLATFFLFDHWSNFGEHFLDPATGEVTLPDEIWVMDELARMKLEKALSATGCQARTRVVGHPALERQLAEIASFRQEDAEALRRHWGAHGRKLQVFLLEPIEDDFPGANLGYTEYSTFAYFLEHLADPDATVLVRPHPRQNLDEVRTRIGRLATTGPRIEVSGAGSVVEVIAAADEVYGITTIALVLARKAGKPTWSVQVGRTAAGAALSNPHLEEILVL